MTHKADNNFFQQKRTWSKRKDEILGCYLTAYLPKIMTVGKPVLIVDGFAGPGKFDDGQNGSPLIICNCIHQTNRKNLPSHHGIAIAYGGKVLSRFWDSARPGIGIDEQ